MLESHLSDKVDIIRKTRDISSIHKEETESVIHSSVSSLRLHNKPVYSDIFNKTTSVSQKQYVFLFSENIVLKGDYILYNDHKYYVDSVENMKMYSGYTQYRAICNELE